MLYLNWLLPIEKFILLEFWEQIYVISVTILQRKCIIDKMSVIDVAVEDWWKRGTEGRNEIYWFTRCFQHRRIYHTTFITLTGEEIPCSIRIVEAPFTAFHNASHLYSNEGDQLMGIQWGPALYFIDRKKNFSCYVSCGYYTNLGKGSVEKVT